MSNNSKTILKRLKDKKVGAFYDDSNLYHAYRNYGWRIDIKKFRNLLEQACDLQFFNYHLAVPDKSDNSHKGTIRFLKKIKPYVTIKTKQLKYTPKGNTVKKKGDVDVEIVLDVVRTVDDLDVVVVVSGDSDYLELKNYVVEDKNKNIIFVGYEENMAWELRQCQHIYVNRIKGRVVLE